MIKWYYVKAFNKITLKWKTQLGFPLGFHGNLKLWCFYYSNQWTFWCFVESIWRKNADNASNIKSLGFQDVRLLLQSRSWLNDLVLCIWMKKVDIEFPKGTTAAWQKTHPLNVMDPKEFNFLCHGLKASHMAGFWEPFLFCVCYCWKWSNDFHVSLL